MKKRLIFTEMTVLILMFFVVITGCSNSPDNNTIDEELIGKWETIKLIISEVEHDLPFDYMDSGGYRFYVDGFTSYVNEHPATYLNPGLPTDDKVYTENGIIYYGSQPWKTYTIIGDQLILNDVDSFDGEILNKTTMFSWE